MNVGLAAAATAVERGQRAPTAATAVERGQ
jgi:hypothetical protein